MKSPLIFTTILLEYSFCIILLQKMSMICCTVVRRFDVSENSAPTSSVSFTPSRYQDSLAPGQPFRETHFMVTFLPNSNSPLRLSTLLASSITGGSGATALGNWRSRVCQGKR
uniref:Secreted protein n=1 Tax=Anopheles melas TaxID=34690 RepID=A0A182TEF0_9DIPT